MSYRWFLLSAALISSVLGTHAGQFNETGPYSVGSYTKDVVLALPGDSTVTVPVILTFPSSEDGPFPLIVMFNGFEVSFALV